MRRVKVGIYVHAEPARLTATLDSLRSIEGDDSLRSAGGYASLLSTEGDAVRLLVLGDGPDAETRAALAALDDVQQSNTAEPRGVAACFNRLVASSDADVYVLLESGARVAQEWLRHLLTALDSDARNGLAGPSTNHCWNEQCVRRGFVFERELDEAAREVERRFGSDVRELTPLHSLADFCYAVRREVVEAVGEADEEYGLGPCWEMDYNVRAARAGWRGVWACASYVERAPFTARRALAEAQRFDASKRRYQDKFCGARLRGEKTAYRRHCRGDACLNFAPSSLIRIRQPLQHARPTDSQSATTITHAQSAEAASFASVPATTTAVASAESAPLIRAQTPLVTCIMPTADRRPYVAQAIRYFQRQDYPNLELLIVDDGADAIADCVPDDPRIRYVRLAHRMNVGAKRNFACAQARGEFIVHWDDDDWYPAWRVGAQARALIEGGADLCGTSRLYYYEAATRRAWSYAYGGGRAPWVAGNTLAYRKSFWERRRFPEIQVGEDSRFVWGAGNARVHDLDDPTLCVALVHAENTSRKITGGAFWRPLPFHEVAALLGDDLHLHAADARAEDWPLVSCIMPTFNRRAFVPLAIGNFLRQDYPNKELIIVDDGSDDVADLAEGHACVRYLRLGTKTSIGAKRNLACGEARGELIAHWDDDDWYAPDRLRYQAAPILSGEADLTGLVNTFVLELPVGAFWTVLPHLHRRMFVGDVHGGTLVYRRAIFEGGVRYPNSNLAEDAALLRQSMRRGQRLTRLANPGVFVYVRHGRNAWREYAPGSFLDPAGWRSIPQPPCFTPDALSSYQSAAVNTP
jgi:glycosyltransferase involved in cell wall biosynthesis